MKTVFNILVAAVVVWVIWLCFFGKPKHEELGIEVAHVDEHVTGIKPMKVCKNYFSRPISVAYGDTDDILYVSCLNDVSSDESYPGYVCKTNIFGEIIDTLDIPELRAPKGLAVYERHLYIADQQRVVRYDLESDSVDHVYLMPKSMYLADVVVSRLGDVYVSDSHAMSVYRLRGDSAQVFCHDSLCNNITGLCMDGDNLVAGAKNAILKFAPNGKVSTVSKTSYSAFGIRCIDSGVYLASDLVGNIHYIKDGKSSVAVKRQNEVNTADFEYVAAQRMIYMPTYADNSLVIMLVGENM